MRRKPTSRSEERRVGKECRSRGSQGQAEDGIRDGRVTGVQTCALPILSFTVKIAGDTLRQGAAPGGHLGTIAKRDEDYGVPPVETVSAYNPVTGELMWQHEHATKTNI